MGAMEKVNAARLKIRVKSRLNKATAMGKQTNHSPMRLNVSLSWLAPGNNTRVSDYYGFSPGLILLQPRSSDSQLAGGRRRDRSGLGARGLFSFQLYCSKSMLFK